MSEVKVCRLSREYGQLAVVRRRPAPVGFRRVVLLLANALGAALFAGCLSTASLSHAYKIGDRGPAGGFVFYDKGDASDGWRYLEAAPADQTGPDGVLWKTGDFVRTPFDTEVGAGRTNTRAILEAQGPGDYAARLCAALTIGGHSDWFLPSKDELDLMYQNLKSNDIGGFGDGLYWTSSQAYNQQFAWYQSFAVGFQAASYKTGTFLVRACRAF